MSDHKFDILTQLCVGCDIAASTVREQELDLRRRSITCPASYELIGKPEGGIIEVIAAPDRLIIRELGGELLRLDAAGARALIYAAGGSC